MWNAVQQTDVESRFRISDFGFRLLILLLFLTAPQSAFAQAKAMAVLSETRVQVGDPVEYRIEVSGARSASRPAQIAVDGLNITPIGSGQQFTYQPGVGLVGTVTYTYLVETSKPGTFTIPEQQFAAGSETVRTNAVTLTVVGAGSGGGAAKQPDYFAKLIIPKTTAYAGEAVPAEVRIYLDPRIRNQFDQTLQLKGEGFTAQKFTDISEEQAMVEGKPYRVFILKTSFVPLKSGPLEVGPFETTCAASMPRPRPRGFPNDPFSDPLFNDPFGGFAINKRIELKTQTVQMEIKPLPPGAPKSFGGAIGQFTFDASAEPKKLGVGDPLTMKLSVGGRGNFDRFDAPVPVDDKGWKAYPATGKFRAEDEVRMRGVKVFEQVLTPTENKAAAPVFEFSYFDPQAEQYKTLRSTAIPISVTGGAAPTPTPAPTGAQTQPQTTAPTAAPTPAATPTPPPATDILHIRVDGPGGGSFEPLAAKPWFWLLQGVPFLLVAGLLGRLWWERRPAKAARKLALAESARVAELERTVRDSGTSTRAFLQAAIGLAQYRAVAGPGVGPREIASRLALDPAEADLLVRLFEERDALVFSGEAGHDLSVDDRRRFRELVERIGRPVLQPA